MSAPAPYPMLIGGELTGSDSGEWLDSVNPADEQVIGRTPAGTATDIARAVGAAQDAFPGWRALSAQERAGHLRALAAKLAERGEEILELEVRDTGNTIRKMRSDVSRAIESLEYYAGLGLELKGETVPATASGLHYSVREPYGVVARIIPFNHPVQFAAAKLAAPLAAGNTLVIKPSEQSPLSASLLAEVCREVLPPGVVNIVTGLGAATGEPLVRDPRVRRIAFIGSAATGMRIQRTAAESGVKNVTLELGGKNPMIVFPDADLAKAVPAAVAGMNFAWAGQSCGSMSRLFLHEDVHDRVVEEITSLVEGLRIGDPLDEASDMGPVNSRAQYDKALHYIEAAREDGARIATGGRGLRGDQFPAGYWVAPTVCTEVKPGMRVFGEEVFGPVLSVVRWSDPDEVIRMANDVEYGLTASVWTRDLDTALTTVRRVDAGYVWVNDVSKHFTGTGFGGVKNSGLGREEGIEELYSYTESKFVHVNI
ncbi:aldehyde dehydrogenase family protein [Streptomyces sp. NPDC050560]|uniref:aldehyde dehydrogenase family protein n=1 Tax=Streptomyces sp. NPDC050560 TaxID=3365630 RepID=UPI00379C7C5E